MYHEGMNFPRLGSLLSEYNLFLASGPVAVLIGIWLLRLGPRPSVPNRFFSQHAFPARNIRAGGILALAIGLVHVLIYLRVLSDVAWWRLDIDQVSELEIVRLDETNQQPTGRPIVVTDKQVIRNALRSLEDNGDYHRNHEHFIGGYEVRIAMPQGGYCLRVYTRSSRLSELTVVEPGNGGTYTSPAFVTWVEQECRAANGLPRLVPPQGALDVP
jgi:hypothetical protein